jgi:regulator of protease activity HflC (stomatin/prohibitin superfamily)
MRRKLQQQLDDRTSSAARQGEAHAQAEAQLAEAAAAAQALLEEARQQHATAQCVCVLDSLACALDGYSQWPVDVCTLDCFSIAPLILTTCL